MAFNSTNPVVVGGATRKTDFDRAFENTLALRAGGVEIASQAAGDLLYATASDQLGRLAIGSVGKILRSTGTLPAWSGTTWPDSGTSGQILRFTGTNAAGADAELAYASPVLSVSASSTGGVALSVLNGQSAGAGVHAYVELRADSGRSTEGLYSLSSGFTESGTNFQSSLLLYASEAGGLTLNAANASGPIRMFAGGTDSANLLLQVSSAGVKFGANAMTFTPAIYGLIGSVASSASSGTVQAGRAEMHQTAASTGITYGMAGTAYTEHATGTVLQANGYSGIASHTGAGTTTTLVGSQAQVRWTSTGGGTDAIGLQSVMTGRESGSGTYVNGYGVYVTTFGAGITNKWSFYSADSGATLYNDATIHAGDGGGFLMTNWPTTGSAGATVVAADGVVIKNVTSVRASKKDIETIGDEDALHVVMSMRGVAYRSAILDDDPSVVHAGFIAEEVEAVARPLAVYSRGRLMSVAYDRVPSYLVPAIQSHERRLQAIEASLRKEAL
jgi:hypothetical protein